MNPSTPAVDQWMENRVTGRRGLLASGPQIMPITLQSTVAFSEEFMQQVPRLEQTMIAHELEPSNFVISKDSASPSTRHVVGTFFYAYTVFIDGEHFTLTEPNDMVFLDYFLKLCTAEEEDHVLSRLRKPPRQPNPLSRFLRWMKQPV
jgi:hypothetical protein